MALTVALALATSAVLPSLAADNKIIVPQLTISPGELQNLQSRQQRLDFQQRQQINRELDSLTIKQRQPTIEVPVMKPGCRPRQVGNSYIAQPC
jgi:hypothetical protein